jgi:hypothetical protein
MNQLELIKTDMQKIDVDMVAKQSTFTGALILFQTLSGLDDKELCGNKGVINATATWSRIKSGDNNFPQDSLNRYMDFCGNEAPLIWLADSHGYVLTPKETKWERQCRIEHEEKEDALKENALLRSLLIGRAA